MRLLIVAVLLMFARSSLAIDLRGVELGDPCGKAEGVETARGFKPKFDLSIMRKDGIYIFEGDTAEGQITTVLYGCDSTHDHVEHYSVAVWRGDLAAAQEIYANTKFSMAQRLGTPSFDSELLTGVAAERFHALAPGISLLRNSSWNSTVDEQIQVSLRHNEINGGWEVVTSVATMKHRVA
jgi:hypothetical protein